jgi:hypothetical protein
VTITQLIQSSPANANELFAKLAATGSGAVKTREALFNDLKSELELHSKMEEEHLFPALRKHKETKDLVRAAVNDNNQARSLLAELDAMWKEGEEFLAKLEELRKVFQQHVRDEKKELLPAVKAALTDKEVQAITENVVADRAKRDEAKRQDAEERRSAARQKREKAERRRAQAEARQRLARQEEQRKEAQIRAETRRVREEESQHQAEAESEQRRVHEAGAALARTGESLRDGQAGTAAAQASSGGIVRSSQQIGDVVGEGPGETAASAAHAVATYPGRALPAMERMQAVASFPPAMTRAAAEAGKTWLELIQRTAESRGRRSLAFVQCFTPPQLAQVQSRYVGETVQAWLAANTRMLDISIEAYRSIMQSLEQAEESTKEARKGA